MTLRSINGSRCCRRLSRPVPQHFQPQHGHSVFKINQILSASGNCRPGMLNKAQISRRIISQNQPVRANLYLAIGHLQCFGKQDWHPGHMQDMPLVT